MGVAYTQRPQGRKLEILSHQRFENTSLDPIIGIVLSVIRKKGFSPIRDVRIQPQYRIGSVGGPFRDSGLEVQSH
jgi:hypothetical protein